MLFRSHLHDQQSSAMPFCVQLSVGHPFSKPGSGFGRHCKKPCDDTRLSSLVYGSYLTQSCFPFQVQTSACNRQLWCLKTCPPNINIPLHTDPDESWQRLYFPKSCPRPASYTATHRLPRCYGGATPRTPPEEKQKRTIRPYGTPSSKFRPSPLPSPCA